MEPGKRQQSTTSSPPPQIIAPSTSKPATVDAKSKPASGVPLSRLKEAVAKEQQETVVNDEAQPSRLLEISLVGVQFVALFVIIAAFVPPLLWRNTFLQVFGMLLVGLALFVAIWAIYTFKQRIRILPSPDPNGFLVTGGPFGYIRHPLYFSLLVGSLGLSLAYPTIPRLVALGVLAFVLYVKMNYEEALLAKRYNGYEKYRAHTGKLLPKFVIKESSQFSPPANPDIKEKE